MSKQKQSQPTAHDSAADTKAGSQTDQDSTQTDKAAGESKLTLRHVAGLCWKGYRTWWSLEPRVLIAPTLTALLNGLTPYVAIWLSARIIDQLAGARNPHVLFGLVAAALTTAAVFALLTALASHWSARYGDDTQLYLQDKMFSDKLRSLEFSHSEDPHTAELMSSIRQTQTFTGYGLWELLNQYQLLLQAVMTVLGALALTVSLFFLPVRTAALAFLNNPLFSLLLLALMAGALYLSPRLHAKAGEYMQRAFEAGKMGNRFFTFFGNTMLRNQRALDARIYRQDRFVAAADKLDTTFAPQGPIATFSRGPRGLLDAASAVVTQLFTGLAFLFVGLKALGGAFGVGLVTQYIASITALFGGLVALITALADLRINAAFLQPVFELLELPEYTDDRGLSVDPTLLSGAEPPVFEFHDVSFKYPGAQAYSLEHINLSLPAGRRLAIVGENGSGKTTLVKLLARFYEPTEGYISLDGVDIRQFNESEYMKLFAVVFQDFQLLSFSLGQNVATAVDYESARVGRALHEAGFDRQLAEKMPAGLDTMLHKDFDQHGVDVSGGEGQKVALARALYKSAPSVVLDEPTAALDPVAESEVYEHMNGMVGGRTAVFISHRLSSCRFCDQIAVFDAGHLVQLGRHEDLVGQADGKYAELWNAQAQYYA